VDTWRFLLTSLGFRFQVSGFSITDSGAGFTTFRNKVSQTRKGLIRIRIDPLSGSYWFSTAGGIAFHKLVFFDCEDDLNKAEVAISDVCSLSSSF
jgi:hypothetical protein